MDFLMISGLMRDFVTVKASDYNLQDRRHSSYNLSPRRHYRLYNRWDYVYEIVGAQLLPTFLRLLSDFTTLEKLEILRISFDTLSLVDWCS